MLMKGKTKVNKLAVQRTRVLNAKHSSKYKNKGNNLKRIKVW